MSFRTVIVILILFFGATTSLPGQKVTASLFYEIALYLVIAISALEKNRK